MSEYEVQANEFLRMADTKMTISRVGEVKGFPFDKGDKLWHYKYQVTLSRNHKQYRFTFYDSFANLSQNKRPSRYDVLASVEKYDPVDFDWFCSEFGYECEDPQDEKLARKVYKACQKQYERLNELFGDELMIKLQEIC